MTIDRAQISRGVFLKGANCPGVAVRKDLSPEERKADLEGRVAAALKASGEKLARDIDGMKITLAARRWRNRLR